MLPLHSLITFTFIQCSIYRTEPGNTFVSNIIFLHYLHLSSFLYISLYFSAFLCILHFFILRKFDGAYRRPMDAIFDNWINGMNILNSTLSWWYVFLVSTLTIANHSKNLPGHFCVQHVNQLWASLHQPQAPQPSFCSAKVWNIPCDCFYE